MSYHKENASKGGLAKGLKFKGKYENDVSTLFKNLATQEKMGLIEFCNSINIPYKTYSSLVKNSRITPKNKDKIINSGIFLSDENLDILDNMS